MVIPQLYLLIMLCLAEATNNNNWVAHHLSISHVHVRRLYIIMYYRYIDKNWLFSAFYNSLQIFSSAEYTHMYTNRRN